MDEGRRDTYAPVQQPNQSRWRSRPPDLPAEAIRRPDARPNNICADGGTNTATDRSANLDLANPESNASTDHINTERFDIGQHDCDCADSHTRCCPEHW